MKHRGWVLVGVAVLIVAAASAMFINIDSEHTASDPDTASNQGTVSDQEKTFDPEPDPNAKQVTFTDENRINEQEQIEQELLNTYNEGDYSFEEPFVTVDPYGTAPLTALAMFETDEPTQITVIVEGKDDDSDVEKTFSDYQTEHEIPILGLYPDAQNAVTIKATKEDGEVLMTSLSIQTEPLPDDFLTTERVEAEPEKMEKGMTFIVPSSRYVYAVDANADVRWYSTLWNSHVFKRLKNGNLLYLTKEEGQDKYNELLEMDMLGKVYNAYVFDIGEYEKTNVVHHDVIELPNGNLLATTHDTESEYIEDEMTEIDRETGETLRNFSFRDVFPKEFYEAYDGNQADEGDWFHQNAVWFDDSDNTLLISSRHQDLEMKMSYPDGEIKWILAEHEKWPEEYEKYLLKPVNGAVKFPGGPHAPMTLPDQDDNPDTLDILFYDNNIVITRGNEEVSEEYSRAVQYRINEKEKTVNEVWSYGEERGSALFSSIVGDADYLHDTGNRLLTSGYIEVDEDENARNSRVIEVSDETPANVIFEIVISGFDQGSHRQAYRAERLLLYPEQQWDFEIRK